MNILADASLPGLAHFFPKPFCLSVYHHVNEISSLLPTQEILLCRANLKVDQKLLEYSQIRYVATASSGTDHVDKHWLASRDITLFDAKGCNASSVADYVLSCLAYMQKQHAFNGIKAGVIGLGKVGMQVAARLHAAGLQILTYDPPKVQREPGFKSCSLEELHYVDLLCVHAELHRTHPYPSENLLDEHFIRQLTPNCIIINAARGGIVDENALLTSPIHYCTDVYLNEPKIERRIIEKATLCTPHIAGHSVEAKYRAVAMVSAQLHALLGLRAPTPIASKKINPPQNSLPTWQEAALALYNPSQETTALKNAMDTEAAFLNLRKNHQFRHDFSLYAPAFDDKKIQEILGLTR